MYTLAIFKLHFRFTALKMGSSVFTKKKFFFLFPISKMSYKKVQPFLGGTAGQKGL